MKNIQDLNKEAGKGIHKLLKAGYPLREIFTYDLTEEQMKEYQKVVSMAWEDIKQLNFNREALEILNGMTIGSKEVTLKGRK